MSMEPAKQVDVVAYYRMSSDDQPASIGQQRTQVRKLAEQKGYHILRDYVDEGRSGSKDQQLRVGFQRMLADASERKFSIVLCYDTSRFARLDAIDGAWAKKILRECGVHLETVKEGVIDWESFAGRLTDTVLSEANHLHSLNISKDSLRGRESRLKAGQWPHGSIPYGYDRLYFNGSETVIIPRKKLYRKQPGWKLRLAANTQEAEVVKRIFREFTTRDTSLRQIAASLSKETVPNPLGNGKGWTKDTVKTVLCNLAHIGKGHIGHSRRRAKSAFNRASPLIVDGVCERLIEDAQFEEAQAILSRRKASKCEPISKPRSVRSSFLSGILYCGHCGYRLEKKARNGKTYFTCPSAVRRPTLGCHQWRVHESELKPLVTDILVKQVDNALMQAARAKPPEQADDNTSKLRENQKKLELKIQRGQERYLTAPVQEMQGLLKILNTWRSELDSIKIELSALASRSNLFKVVLEIAAQAQWWHTARKKLVVLTSSHAGGGEQLFLEHDVARKLLRDLGVKVSLFWKKRGERYFELDKGRLQATIDEHALAVRNSKCNRARSRGKDSGRYQSLRLANHCE